MKTKIFYLIMFINLLSIAAFSQCESVVAQRTIGGNLDDILRDAYPTADSGWVLGGYSNSNISGEKTQNSRGSYDYWVVKLNRDLARRPYKQWDKTIGGNADDRLTALQQTTDGGYILGGFSNSNISGEKTQNSRGNFDYWIVKLDKSGNKQWDKTFGGSGIDQPTCIQQTTDGGYIAGGLSQSPISGEKTQASRGGYDYWIVKLDINGNKQWDKTFGGNSSDFLRFIQQTTDGGYILGGPSMSPVSGEKTQASRGGFDYWIVKLDNSGNKQWDKTFGGSGDENCTALQQTTGGGYILGGYSNSNISGEKTQASRGGYDYWIIRINQAGSIIWNKTFGGSGDDKLIALQQATLGSGGYIFGGYSNSNISGEKTENRQGLEDYWMVKTGTTGIKQWDKTVGGNQHDELRFIQQSKQHFFVAAGYSASSLSGCKTRASVGNDYWIVVIDDELINTIQQVASTSAASTNLSVAHPKNKEFRVYPVPATNILHVQGDTRATYSLTDMAGKVLLTKNIAGNGTINVSQLQAGMYFLKNNETGVIQTVIVSK
jgi:hypothetical protein